MSTSEYRNKNNRRPVKSAGPKARRQKLQKTRLIALGMSEEKVEKLNTQQVRQFLRHPKKVTAKATATA